MTQFSGPVQLTNQKFLRNLTQGGHNIATTVPKIPDQEEIRRNNELMAMRSVLIQQQAQQAGQKFRQGMVDRGIIANTEANPVQQSVLNQRTRPRMTIAEINRLSRDALRELVTDTSKDIMGEQRSSIMKFIDVIDLPRNSIFNVAFTDEPDWEGLAAGAGVMAAGGAVIGGIGGAFFGGVGAIPGAVAGAKAGAAIYGATLGVASIIGHTALSEEDRKQIRLSSEEQQRAALGMRRVYFSEVLKRFGIENRTTQAVVGILGDIALDPLSYVTGGGTVVKWGVKGMGVKGAARGAGVAVESRGVRFLKDATKEAMKKGRVITDDAGNVTKLIMPEGSQYKMFEDLVNNNLLIDGLRFGDNPKAVAFLADIGPGLDLDKRLSQVLKVIGESGQTRKVKKAQVSRIMTALQEELLEFRRLAPVANKNQIVKDTYQMSKEFFKRFSAKAGYQTHIPFMDWVAPLLWRRIGYRNLGTNIPIARIGVRARQYKMLKTLDDPKSMFGAAEAAARADMLATVGRELGRYAPVKNVLNISGNTPEILAARTEKALSELPESIRNKVTVTAQGERKNTISVDALDLKGTEYDYLRTQKKWKFDHPEASAEFVFDAEGLSTSLGRWDRLQEIDGITDVARYVEERVIYDDAARIFGETLERWKNADKELRKTLDLGEGAPPRTPNQQAELDRFAERVTETEAEIKALLARRDLVDRNLEDVLTPRSSMLLDAIDGVRGEFAGQGIGIYAGPGFFSRMFNAHNAKVGELQDRIARLTREERLTRREFTETIGRVSKASEGDRKALAGLREELGAINDQRRGLLGEMPQPSDVARAKAAEVGEAFGLNKEESEALGILLDALGETWAVRTGGKLGTKEDWIANQFTVIKGGDTPEGRQVLFHGGEKIPERFNSFYAMHRAAREEVGAGKGATVASAVRAEKWKDPIGNIAKHMGYPVKVDRMHTGVTRGRGGEMVHSNLVAIDKAVTEDEAVYMATVGAFLNGHTEASVFLRSAKGHDTAFIVTQLERKATEGARKFMDDLDLGPGAHWSLHDNGNIIITVSNKNKGQRFKAALEKIKEKTNVKKGEDFVKEVKGKLVEIHPPGIKAGLKGEEATTAAARFFYNKINYFHNFKGVDAYRVNGADPIREYAERLGIHMDADEWTEFASLTAVRALKPRGDMTAREWLDVLRSPAIKKVKSGRDKPRNEWLKETEWPFRHLHGENRGNVYGVPEDELVNSGLRDFLESIAKKKGANHKIQAGEIEDFLNNNELNMQVFNMQNSDDVHRFLEMKLQAAPQLKKELSAELTAHENKYGRIMDDDDAFSAAHHWERTDAWEEVSSALQMRSDEAFSVGNFEEAQSLVRLQQRGDLLESPAGWGRPVVPAGGDDWARYVEDGAEGLTNLLIALPPQSAGRLPVTARVLGTHWPGTMGVIAHARLTTKWINGKKILQIEEIQSDAIQAASKAQSELVSAIAREYGVKLTEWGQSLERMVNKSDKVPKEVKALLKHKGFNSEEFARDLQRLHDAGPVPVGPSAYTYMRNAPEPLPLSVVDETVGNVPFWEKMVMRRVIKHMYEGGYEGISVSRGAKMDNVMAGGDLAEEALPFLTKHKGRGATLRKSGDKVEVIRDGRVVDRVTPGEFARASDLVASNRKLKQWIDHGADGVEVPIGDFYNPGLVEHYDGLLKLADDMFDEMVGRANGAPLFTREAGVKLKPGASVRLSDDTVVLGPDDVLRGNSEELRALSLRADARGEGRILREVLKEFSEGYGARLSSTKEMTANEKLLAASEVRDVLKGLRATDEGWRQQSELKYLDDIFEAVISKDPALVAEMRRVHGERVDYIAVGKGALRSQGERRAGRKGNRLWQTGDGDVHRASIEWDESGKALIRALNSPDVGSFIHELGHHIRRFLPAEDLKMIENKWGLIDEWDVATEEKFAEVFMDYLQTRNAPTPELQQAFDTIGGAMKSIYGKLNSKGGVRGKMKGVLDKAFGGTEESIAQAKELRGLNKKAGSLNNKANRKAALVTESAERMEDLAARSDMAGAARREALAPLEQELSALKETAVHRASVVAERFERSFRDITGAGRRGTFAGQAVSKFRHAHENLPEFQRRLVIDAFDKDVATISSRLNMIEGDAHTILLAKIISKDMQARGVQGFHPSDLILNSGHEGGLDNIMAKYGGRDTIWNDAQIDRLAERIQKRHADMAIHEAAIGALATADPQFAYVPLRMTDEAQRAAWARAADVAAAGARDAARAGHKISAKEAATIHRATNRIFYRTEDAANAHWVDESGDGWNYIWSGQLDGRPLPAEYEAYKLAYLRQNPDKMLPGDIYDYNRAIYEAGGDPSTYLPTPGLRLPKGRSDIGNRTGARWQPAAHPTSPMELNNPQTAHRFAEMMGSEFKGQVWETDLSLVLGKRAQEHWRMDAVHGFLKNIKPEMKVLTNEEVADAVRNPRQGTRPIVGGRDIMINGVPYRRLSTEVTTGPTEKRMLETLMGSDGGTHYYPEDVARGLEDYLTRITDDENLTAIGNAFDYVQSIWKGSVLMNPAWTTVNILGGVIHSVVVGRLTMGDFAEHYMNARRLAQQFHFGNKRGAVIPTGPGMIFDDTKKYVLGDDVLTETEIVEEMVRINAIDGSQAAREAINLHRTAFGNPDAYAKKTIMDRVRRIATFGPLGAWWFKFNASIDDTFRTTVYLARRAKGDSAEEAALLMKKAHFDYGDFTKMEESIGRRLIPFYAWQRNNIALQYKLLFNRPGYQNLWHKIKHAVEVEGLNEEDNVPLFMMPRWLKNQLMVQTSGMDGETKGLILGNLTPVDDLLKTAQGVFGYEGFEEMMHYFVGSSTPILKSVFELGMGRQSFNGQAIGDEDMMEMSITEYMKKQVGYYSTYKGLETAVTRDGLEGLLWRLAVRGRWQPLDVDRLQARISIDTSEDIKLLRRGINRAMQEGDEERAEAIAMRIIENYRVLWQSGVRHRVPKELWPQFRREEGMLRREGRPIPGANIPIQQPSP